MLVFFSLINSFKIFLSIQINSMAKYKIRFNNMQVFLSYSNDLKIFLNIKWKVLKIAKRHSKLKC